MWRWCLILLAGGCAATEPLRTTAGLAPSPPGWFAFCAARGAVCDAVPAAAAMPDGDATSTPPGWRDYCRRVATDPACGQRR